MNKLGLVVEGGGVRAIFAAGVLDALHDMALPIQGVIGVSAGAIHGCSFVSGQRGRSITFYRQYCRDSRFFSLWNWMKTGNLVDTEFCYHEIPERLVPYDHEAFRKSAMEFWVTCTNLETGGAEYIQITDMARQIDALRASASIPYVSQIVSYEGKKLLDGGCSDSVPLQFFESQGFTRNIVVLTRPDQGNKSDRDATLASLFYRKYPNFVRTFRESPENYRKTQAYIEARRHEGAAFVIRPNGPVPAGRLTHNPKDIDRAYQFGFSTAMQQRESLLTWIRADR